MKNITPSGLCGNRRFCVKKVLAILFMIALSFFTACNLDDFAGDWEYDPHTSSYDLDYCKTIIDEVIRCFDEEDVDALEDMFSEYKKNKYNLERQIKKAMEVYNGKSVSCDEYSFSITGANVYYGYYSSKCGEAEYSNVVMDSGEEYCIIVGIYLVEDDDPSKVGLTHIVIKDANYICDFEHMDSTLVTVGR